MTIKTKDLHPNGIYIYLKKCLIISHDQSLLRLPRSLRRLLIRKMSPEKVRMIRIDAVFTLNEPVHSHVEVGN